MGPDLEPPIPTFPQSLWKEKSTEPWTEVDKEVRKEKNKEQVRTWVFWRPTIEFKTPSNQGVQHSRKSMPLHHCKGWKESPFGLCCACLTAQWNKSPQQGLWKEGELSWINSQHHNLHLLNLPKPKTFLPKLVRKHEKNPQKGTFKDNRGFNIFFFCKPLRHLCGILFSST